MAWIGIVAAVGNMVLSGITAVIYKSQSEKVRPALMLIIQTIVASVAFLIITSAMGDFNKMFKIDVFPFLAFVFAAIIGVIFGNYFYLISLKLLGVSKAYPIAMTYPLLTYFFELLFFSVPFEWFKLLGIVLVVVGVILISFSHINDKLGELNRVDLPSVNTNTEEQQSNEIILDSVVKQKEKEERDIEGVKKQNAIFLGVMLAILCTLTWAAGTTLLKYGLNHTTVEIIPINSARMIYLVPASVIFFFATKEHKHTKKISWKAVTIIAIGALLGLVAANIFYLIAIDEIGASTPAAIAASGPMIATPLSILFLKEKVDWKIILGTALTIAGNIFVIMLI